MRIECKNFDKKEVNVKNVNEYKMEKNNKKDRLKPVLKFEIRRLSGRKSDNRLIDYRMYDSRNYKRLNRHYKGQASCDNAQSPIHQGADSVVAVESSRPVAPSLEDNSVSFSSLS